MLSSFLFLSAAILFSDFFLFLFGVLGRCLTYHACFSSEDSTEKPALFSGISGQRDQPYCMPVRMSLMEMLWEKHRPGHQARLPGHR